MPIPVLRRFTAQVIACALALPVGTFAQHHPREVLDSLKSISTDQDPHRRTRRAEALSEWLSAAGALPSTDSSVLFIFRGQAARVSVAGDFNGWDTRHDTLAGVPGTGFFVAERRYDPASRFEYKIVADTVWGLDRYNRATAMGGFGPNSEIRMPRYVAPVEIVPVEGVPRGTLDTLTLMSPTLGRAHPVTVYIPAGHHPGRSRLPAIYVMDGGEYLSLASMATILDNLVFARRIPPVAAVFVDPRTNPRDPSSTTRMTDYALNPVFITALVNDFCRPVTQRYGLDDRPSMTAIMGASMGGLVATYAALTRPDIFGLCGAQSPSYQWQRGALLETARTLPRSNIRFSIDTGTMRDALEHAQRMSVILSRRGYPVRFRTSPEGHNWVNWRAHIGGLLEYLFAASPLDRLGIATGQRPREYSFTNKRTAFYYGSTAMRNSGSWMGFHVGGEKLFDDYTITLQDRELDRSSASTTVYPDRIVRSYPGAITEEWSLADSLALCWVTVRAPHTEDLRISLLKHEGPGAGGDRIATTTRSIPAEHCIQAVFSAGRDHQEAVRIGSWAAQRLDSLAGARRTRMEEVLTRASVSTGDERFDAALSWAVLSLDALIMHQGKKGIYAGLPWFTNYWGRDTFISLPGAVLVTGRFHEAREILLSFASFQQRNPRSSDYGRIPNIVNPGDVAYNTADGTPRFVMMAEDYLERSGDAGFLQTIYPTVVRSIDGTMRHHMDSLGFLVHADAETWMDAAGPQGAWSPRGNRANDVQALWAQQLDAGIRMAAVMRDARHESSWKSVRRKLGANFQRLFVVHGKIVDHLKPDGTPDQQERPNTIFTRRLVPDSVFAREIRNVVEHLTYPYGVASLAQTDADFHPYHEYPPMYPKDAAYHNGTVWTWLQGPLISELCRYGCTDLAWELTQNTVHQILDRGTAGTQSELLDAVPRPGESEPRLSGTFSQAWNLAEFVRTFYDDYLGIKVLSGKKELWLNPHLPEILTDVRAPVTLNGSQLMVELHRIGDTTRYVFDARSCSTPLTASLVRHDRVFSLSLQSGATTTCQIVGKAATASTGAGEVRVNTKQITPAPQIEGKLAFATPIVSPGLRAMQGPGYPLISNATIKRTNPTAQLLVDAMDPEGDDTGVDCSSGALLEYTYPLSRHFVAGSFDITRFTARRDSATLYCVLQFKRLSDPGWHPEYGFQLTYCAIAIDNAPGGKRQIGHNAACMVDEGSSFERLITVGGGVQVEDATGKILGAYLPVPADAASPLGDAGSGTITFALPLTLVGPIDSLTRFTILAGAQDDHGGAGIGEFRTVNEKAGEWNGGGRRGSSNVYDRLVAGR